MTDDDLRTRLGAADPAASLPPLPPARIAHLLEQAMATPFAGTTAHAGTTALAEAPARWRRTPLLVAAAVALIGLGAGWLLLRPAPGADPSKPTAGPASAAPSVTRLTAPGVAAKCVEPTARILATRADFAVAATVRDVAGETVTLQVTHVYKGAAVGLIEVPQAPGASEGLMGSGSFEAGRKYLVAASQGNIITCGYSGEAGAPGLQALYDQAF